METNRILHFKTLVEVGNMRKAAELLGISNGGLSKSIKTLESELNVTLTAPDGRGLQITDDGKRVYQNSLLFLDSLEQFSSSIRNSNKYISRVVRLGTFEVFSTYFLGQMLSNDFNETEVMALELVPGKLEAAIAEGEVDIGITYLPIPTAGVQFSKVCSTSMGIFTRVGAFESVETRDLPFVVPINPVQGSPTGVKGLDGWPEHLFPRKVRYRVELMETGLELCRKGLAAVFIPNFIARLHNEEAAASFKLKRRANPSGLTEVIREVFLVYRNGSPENQVAKKVAKAIRLTCRE